MVNNQLLNVVERVLGNGYKLRNGEYQFFCSECNHHKRKLQINFDENSSNFGKAHCWVCNFSAHTIPQLLRKVGAPKSLIKEALQLVNEYVSYETDKEEIKHNVSLPKEYKPLYIKSNDPIYKNAIYYLKQRRIGPQEILRYSIGYCDRGPYSNRIIIPSYDEDGKLNYFIARSIFSDKFKYKNPNINRDVIIFDLFINWKCDITIVEGIFDAISIRKNALPLLGKFMSKKLIKKIIVKKPPRVNVCLDSDAKESSIKLMEQLVKNGIKVCFVELPDNQDPSDLGFDKMSELISNSVPISSFDIIKMKIG